MIKATNLVKHYGKQKAVDNISFGIKKGEIVGFLGPNGAGKSTTMNMLTGFLAPTSGTIEIDGINVREDPIGVKRKIGYLPEIPPLYPDMTVKSYLSFVAQLKGLNSKTVKSDRDRVMEVVQITDQQNRLIDNLSKGYKQRVGVAQALLGNPDLLILDEPSVGLDPKQIIEMRNLITKLGQEHTVILSSHILPEVSAICNRLLILNKGKIAASDTPENLAKMMEGTNQIQLKIKANQDNIRSAIKDMKAVTLVQCQKSSEDGIINMILKAEDDRDIREEVFYLMSRNKFPIMQMRPSHISLEEIFLNLTTTEKEL
ncbi:ABC transporter ATP-binding protein [Spirochaeta cellobiosiphila]|uniref:ABC transporter ATP-binding protein n=1 Tax=Spirochaeta cellobiosiphila TaxID=504483 RepID=UPI00040B7E67|nr:ATP-binding cassette domain-containing protein [Spirochaeta cellobiosiphila]